MGGYRHDLEGVLSAVRVLGPKKLPPQNLKKKFSGMWSLIWLVFVADSRGFMAENVGPNTKPRASVPSQEGPTGPVNKRTWSQVSVKKKPASALWMRARHHYPQAHN